MTSPHTEPDIQTLLTAPDGTPLHYTEWMPKLPHTDGRATILLSHGYGEHLGRYGRLARQLTAAGFRVGGCDHRGMGRSGGPRMVIDDYNTYVADLDTAQARLRQGIPDAVPAFVFGHSMGGLVALRHAQSRNTQAFKGTVLSGPLLGVGFPVPAWQIALGKVLARVAPRYHFPLQMRPELLTHDLDEQQAALADPLMPGFTTPAWFMATNRAMEQGKDQADRVCWPTLWQVGGADQVCSPAASKAVYDLLTAAHPQAAHTWHLYAGLMHEVYNERLPDREQAFADLSAWLNARLAGDIIAG